MAKEKLSPKVEHASRHTRRGQKPGDKTITRQKRRGAGVERLQQGQTLLEAIKAERESVRHEHATTVARRTAPDRELATQLWQDFKQWLLANPNVDFHVRCEQEMDVAWKYLQCFFYPGTFPTGLTDKTVDELLSAFVTFCIQSGVSYGTLPGQKTKAYSKEWEIQQLRIFREKAVQQVEDEDKEKEKRRARFAGEVTNFAIKRLEGDPMLDDAGREAGVAYFQALLSGSSEPDIDIRYKTLDRIRFNLALSFRIKNVRIDFFPFQSLDWFVKKSIEARRVLQPRSA